jgi:hypothetical protein
MVVERQLSKRIFGLIAFISRNTLRRVRLKMPHRFLIRFLFKRSLSLPTNRASSSIAPS